ncbi:hypothetical protein [Hanamia caeni]
MGIDYQMVWLIKENYLPKTESPNTKYFR